MENLLPYTNNLILMGKLNLKENVHLLHSKVMIFIFKVFLYYLKIIQITRLNKFTFFCYINLFILYV